MKRADIEVGMKVKYDPLQYPLNHDREWLPGTIRSIPKHPSDLFIIWKPNMFDTAYRYRNEIALPGEAR